MWVEDYFKCINKNYMPHYIPFFHTFPYFPIYPFKLEAWCIHSIAYRSMLDSVSETVLFIFSCDNVKARV